MEQAMISQIIAIGTTRDLTISFECVSVANGGVDD